MFWAHRCAKVKNEADKLRTTLAVIPGWTSILQPLDVCLNKLFKDNTRKYWSEQISSGLPEETKGRNLKRPDIVFVTKWVKQEWEKIPNETVISSFKKDCMNSNKLDDTEDVRFLAIVKEILQIWIQTRVPTFMMMYP